VLVRTKSVTGKRGPAAARSKSATAIARAASRTMHGHDGARKAVVKKLRLEYTNANRPRARLETRCATYAAGAIATAHTASSGWTKVTLTRKRAAAPLLRRAPPEPRPASPLLEGCGRGPLRAPPPHSD